MKPLLLSLLVAVNAHAVELRDDSGLTQRFDGPPPQRVVSLLPSLTESVCAQGGCARLVAVDRHSNHPPSVRELPHLGGLDEISVESVVALKPDVVFVPPSARLHERLRALGLRVVVLDGTSQSDVQRQLDAVGRVLGVADPGAPWQALQRRLTREAELLAPALRGQRVYFEVDATPYAAGEASFIGETLARLGLKNIVPAALGPFPKLNPEFIVRADPQLIVVSAREVERLAARPGWAGISALKHHRVCALKPEQSDVIVRPGPRLAEGAALLRDCLERAVERPLAR